MCRRLSGHAILCSQGKWGRGGQPRVYTLGSLRPVRGCVEPSITLSEAACRWRHVRVLEVKIYYFFFWDLFSGTPASISRGICLWVWFLRCEDISRFVLMSSFRPMNRCTPVRTRGYRARNHREKEHCAVTGYVIWDLLFRSPMASWLDDLGLNELEHIKDGASAFAQELHPINSAEDFISFVVALNLYPPGTPLRAERIAGEMPAGLSAPAVRYLLSKLPIVDRLASQLRDDPSRKTVRLVPDVEHCVACGLAGEAVPLVVKRADKCSSPTVYAEHGRLKGELNGLSCPRCSAWHSMSYAEGGTRIPAGKQVPYPGATASSRRWIQLSQSTVFENSLLDRLSAQMVHSHTGFETFCHEWAMRCGESKDLAHTMRRRLGHTWLAWSLLRWRDENASRAGEPLPFEPLGFTSDEQLDAT